MLPTGWVGTGILEPEPELLKKSEPEPDLVDVNHFILKIQTQTDPKSKTRNQAEPDLLKEKNCSHFLKIKINCKEQNTQCAYHSVKKNQY